MQNWVAPASRGRARGGEHLVEVEEGVHVDAGVEPHRLRAERAVFGARARLGVDEALELDLGPAPREAHLVRERDERGQLVERELGDRERFVAGERAALVEQGAFGGDERQSGHRGIVTRPPCRPSRDPPVRIGPDHS